MRLLGCTSTTYSDGSAPLGTCAGVSRIRPVEIGADPIEQSTWPDFLMCHRETPVIAPSPVDVEVAQPKALVAQSDAPAVLGELLLVHGEDDRAIQKPPIGHGGYLASSRRTLWRFFMISRASFMRRSKSGSVLVTR